MNPNETPKARFPRTLARTGALLAASLLFASTSSLSAGPRNYPRGPEPAFSAIYVFGDSLSDTGRAASVLNPPPPPGSDWLNGRESDGPLWIEQISPILGVDYVAANNFAWGGATSGTGNIYGPGVLPGMLDELAEYLAGLPLTGADPDALYVVFGGSNDFLEVLSGSAGADALAETVANLVTIVHTLRAYGARHIVLVDVPDIGVAPRVLAFGPALSAYVTSVCRDFNTALRQAMAFFNLPVIHVSAFDLTADCAERPRRYGFADTQSVSLPDLDKARTSMFWSDIHPTSRLHGWLAVTMLEKLRAEGLLRHTRTPSSWRPVLVPR